MRIITAFAFAAICAIASADTQQVIAELEAKLAAAQARAGITVDRSARQSAAMNREVRQSSKILAISATVTDLTNRMSELKDAQQADMTSMPVSVAALATAANAVSSSISRIDDTLAAFKLLKSKADAIPAKVEAQVESIQLRMSSLTQTMSSMSQDVETANKATLAEVDAKIAASQVQISSATKALQESSDKSIKDMTASLEGAGKSRSMYVNWGSSKCEGGASTLYTGWTYASYHNSEGGTTPLCLKNAGGDMGGRNGGWDSLDQMYPARTDNCGGTKINDQGNCGKQVPCSLCQIEKSCYLETGNKCSAKGYAMVYKGWLYGSHNSHNAMHQRICISEDGNGWGLNDGHGTYFYPSLNNNGMGSIQSDKTLFCQWCCT